MSDARHIARLAAPFDASVLDLAGCDRLEITVGLYEHESADHAAATWPAAVQAAVTRQVASWRAANPLTEVVCMSTGMIKQSRAVALILHYRRPPPPAPSPDPEGPKPLPAPAGPSGASSPATSGGPASSCGECGGG